MYKEQPFYVKATFMLLFLFLLCMGMVYARSILVPFCVAILLSILLAPVASGMERLGVARLFSSLLSIILVLAIIAGLLYYFTLEVISFVNDIPQLKGELAAKLGIIQSFIEQQTSLSPSRQIVWLNSRLQQGLESSGYFVKGTLFTATHALSMVLPVPFYVFFLLFYRDKVRHFIYRVARQEHHSTLRLILLRIQYIIQSYLTGILIVMLIMASLASLGLWIMDVQYAIFIAVLVAVLNVVPYVGILLGTLCAMIITFITKDNIAFPLFVAALMLVLHLLEANIITPKIVGGKVSINPLAVLLALIIGEQIWGIMGMVLFVPMLGILKVVLDSIDKLKPYGYLLGTEGMDEHNIHFSHIWLWIRRKKAK